MRILGFYPPLKYKGLYKIFANIIYWFCTVSVPTLASIHLMVGENVDVVQISDSSFMIIQVGCFIFKLLPFIHNGDEVRNSIYMMETLFTSYPENQRKLINECKKICHQITWLFFGFCILSLILFATIPLFGHGRKFPIEIWLPFNAKLKVSTYVGSYIFITLESVLGIGNGAASNGVIDPLIAGLACFGATQLRILQNNLQHLDKYVNEKIATQVEPFTFKFFFMSNSITTAIYMSNWYEYDINSKKALIVLMERSQKPMIVTAGKILDLSLVTFTTILRRAYSLLAVLKNY
ncbi:7tm 6 domain containing protein [Asbolus verrucosus]|uniref:7tm 6 domain containing protein n=1 Tax=Asbolus verrucosus TaxID=1661398 RepID=A0A482VKI3_ASBVE|nr:7tm 6 domain containing protein [Asbolus verrucosus]